MDSKSLAAQHKSQFDRDGFVIIRGFYSPAEVATLAECLDHYVRQIVPHIPPADAFFEVKGQADTLKQMQQMDKHEPILDEMRRNARWADIAAGLLGDRADSQGVEWFDKPPVKNTPTPPHQDGYYFMISPNEAVTLWLALDKVDEGNGCVRYVPGSHRRGVRSHARTTTLGFSQGITDFGPADAAAEVKAIAEPGDLLVHHSLTIHRAEANTSGNRHRRALGLVYYAGRAKPDRAAVAAYQKTLEASLAAAGRI